MTAERWKLALKTGKTYPIDDEYIFRLQTLVYLGYGEEVEGLLEDAMRYLGGGTVTIVYDTDIEEFAVIYDTDAEKLQD